jgi:BASS family bile acid:Na+ symporter
MFESLQKLDLLKLNFSAEGQFGINLILACIMFGVGLEIKTEHFKTILFNPKSYIVGLVNQNLIIPFITFCMVISLNKFITPTVAFGMILVAACPGGNISNFMTNFAKGNTALAVSLTATTTLLAVFFVPFNFALWGGLYVKYINAHSSSLLQPITINPFEMIYTVFILLGIPLVLGIFISWKFPVFTSKIVKPVKTSSVAIFMGIVILAFANNFDLFIKYILYVFILVLIENGLAFLSGFAVAKSVRLNEKDVRAITIESGIHNSGLGLALLFNPNIFPSHLAIGGMFFIAGWWGIWHIISGLAISSIWSRNPILEKT